MVFRLILQALVHQNKQNAFPNFPQEKDKRRSKIASSSAGSAASPGTPKREAQVRVAFD